MINLFEHYDSKTAILYQTLELAGQNHFTTVINDNGFLPDTMTSPYQFFANYQVTEGSKPQFFNDIKVPRFWGIEGNNEQAWIKDKGKIRGNIYYKPHYKARIVSHVEWLSEQGKVRFIDHYTKHGVKYAQTTLDKDETPILKKYMNQKGQEVIYENYKTKNIVLDWEGKTYLFDTQANFILFYLKVIHADLSKILINSLATSFAVLYFLKEPSESIVFWQEHIQNEIPENMKLIFEESVNRHTQLVIPEKDEYEAVMNRLNPSEQKYVSQAGYVYDFKKENQYGHNALIMTNSDQIANLELLIRENDTIHFHIGALTEMSSVLMDLGKYDNVNLYPSVEQTTIQSLYTQCDLYLDINEGNEIEDAVKKAFDYNLLILAYSDTLHNAFVTAVAHRFEKAEQASQLSSFIQSIYADKAQFKQALAHQHTHANEIDIPTLTEILD